MLNRVVLVTGCNRGLGLEFLKQLASLETSTGPTLILGTCRNPTDPGPDLTGLLESHPQRIKLHQLDLANLATIPEFAAGITVSYVLGRFDDTRITKPANLKPGVCNADRGFKMVD